MKYLVISDIHGSSKYLKMLFDKVRDFDKLIILGDILYHGPRNNLPIGHNPNEVMKILNSMKEKIIAVRGNCDAKIDLEVLEFEISDHKWIQLNENKILLTHGDVYDKNNLSNENKSYIMLYGHYHINEITLINDVKAINIGSLSLPKDNHHSYSIIVDDTLTSYDLLTNEIIIKENLS